MTSIEVPVQRAALFLDLDGTVADIAATPGEVRPEPSRTALLRWASEALNRRLAIISGRSMDDVDRIVEYASPCVAGVHGLSRRNAAGEVNSFAPHPSLEDVKQALEAVARSQRGLLLEEKTLGVALHYRAAPTAAAAVDELAERLAQTTGLVLQKGDMVAELRTPGADKGQALNAFMAEAPFRGACPIFIGDDLTDEAGFQAAAERGGIGVLVGPPRETRAQARLDGPGDVLAWIACSLDTGAFVLRDGS